MGDISGVGGIISLSESPFLDDDEGWTADGDDWDDGDGDADLMAEGDDGDDNLMGAWHDGDADLMADGDDGVDDLMNADVDGDDDLMADDVDADDDLMADEVDWADGLKTADDGGADDLMINGGWMMDDIFGKLLARLLIPCWASSWRFLLLVLKHSEKLLLFAYFSTILMKFKGYCRDCQNYKKYLLQRIIN